MKLYVLWVLRAIVVVYFVEHGLGRYGTNWFVQKNILICVQQNTKYIAAKY